MTVFFDSLVDFLAFWHVPVVIVVTILVAILLRAVLRRIINRSVDRIVRRAKKRQDLEDPETILNSPIAQVRLAKRTKTLGGVLVNIVTGLITVVAVLIIFNTLVPDATGAFALITAALGAGLGFGAQNVVKDVLNGMFMVAEDQIGVGDVVDTGFATGVVESVDIRITQVRDVNGTLWFVRNGEILRVGNMSQGWARVIIDLAVPYESDVDAVEARILETAVSMSTEEAWRLKILEKPEIWGIESISAEAIIVRLVAKTTSSSKDDVARELRVCIKYALDKMGVRLPALNSVVLNGFEAANARAVPARSAVSPVEDDGKADHSVKPEDV